jgi:hypothetical protein
MAISSFLKGAANMSKRDEHKAELGEVERAFKAIGDTLRRAAKNADALDLKPEAKAWLLDQFGQNKPKSNQPVTDKTLGYARDIIRQQEELEQRASPPVTGELPEYLREIVRQQSEQEQPAKPTSGKNGHADNEQRKRKSKQNAGDLPPH